MVDLTQGRLRIRINDMLPVLVLALSSPSPRIYLQSDTETWKGIQSSNPPGDG
jgi:hypothetical protein